MRASKKGDLRVATDQFESNLPDTVSKPTQPTGWLADFRFQDTIPVPRWCLTAKDYTLLEAHLRTVSNRSDWISLLMARLIRGKLAHARVVLSQDVDADVATGNSEIVFSVGDRADECGVLSHWSDDDTRNDCIPIATVLGTTLLGMSVGQTAPLLVSEDVVGSVTLKRIVHQPEAVRRASKYPARFDGN